MKNVMLDIETWSTGPCALPVSIGAVEFDLEQGELGEEFDMNVDPRDAQAQGFRIMAETVDWWLQQEDEARAALRGDRHKVRRVFFDLATFTHDKCVWGNGSNFDNRIIREGYQLLDLKCPWHYRNDRDMRTFMDMMKTLGITKCQIEHDHTRHTALGDAKFQANVMIDAWQQLLAKRRHLEDRSTELGIQLQIEQARNVV